MELKVWWRGVNVDCGSLGAFWVMEMEGSWGEGDDSGRMEVLLVLLMAR